MAIKEIIMRSNHHSWNFSTIGGVKRVNIETGADLKHLHELDQKLWTALSCPVDNLEIDHNTLKLIDTNNDGQIRVPEIIAAVQWIVGLLNNADELLKENNSFSLSAINVQTEEGKTLYESAQAILRNLGKGEDNSLSVADTTDMVKIFAGTKYNGDGIITELSVAGNEAQVQAIHEIMKCVGSVADRNGETGVHLEHINSFFEACEQYAGWQGQLAANMANIMPLGAETAAAYDNYKLLKEKVKDYFLRCKLAAFDPQSTEALNLKAARVETITNKNLVECIDEIAGYPIATVKMDGTLPLHNGVNPAWQAAVATLASKTVAVLLPGKDQLTEKEWLGIGAKFAPYEAWMADKAGGIVEQLGLERVQQLLSSNIKEELTQQIAADKAVEAEANSIMLVDKLVRYHRDLGQLLRNFVTFYDFYEPGNKAVFQAGTLYIDQRSCDLCVKVRDMGKLGELAIHSGMYLVYCDCVSKATNEKMTIVAAMTNGDVDDLMVGRNAIFYDRSGQDWDATVIKITENPVSIRQAFFAPYRRVSKFVEAQINKAASAADEKSTANLTKGIEEAPDKIKETQEKKAAPVAPFDVAKFAGIFAAIGLALGAIGSVVTAMVTGFLKLPWYEMPFAVAGVLLLISGPSMILAYVKLRKRNLAPILDANGWAINAQVKINIHFGRTLTHLASLPPGARININDPFKKKGNPILPLLLTLLGIGIVVVYVLWKMHKLSMLW